MDSNSAVNLSASTTIPNGQYILFRNNFSGGATTYIAGVQYGDNKSAFESNNLVNSQSVGALSMLGNTTATVVAVLGTYYKILGTTTASSINERFSHTNNRLTYTGDLTIVFKVTAVLTISDGSQKQFSVRVGKNGTTVAETTTTATTSAGNSKAENMSIQGVVSLVTNDYIEIFVANQSGTDNPTIIDMSVILERLTL